MSINLSPDQQAKLEKFEMDAQAAVQAQADADKSSADLIALTSQNQRDLQNAVEDHVIALASAQLFIDAMLGKTPPPPPTAPQKK